MNLRQQAVNYIKSLSEQERNNLKQMVINGATCCITYAEKNNINPQLFNQELKKIFTEE